MRLSLQRRLVAAGLAVVLIVPMVVAATLQPDRRGFGTHQQLGLPPCTIYAVCGFRCPTCGGTTAWANLVRGRGRDALAANVGATLLGLVDLAGAAWLLLSAIRGRWFLGLPSAFCLAWVMIAVTVVTLIDWVVRLASG